MSPRGVEVMLRDGSWRIGLCPIEVLCGRVFEGGGKHLVRTDERVENGLQAAQVVAEIQNVQLSDQWLDPRYHLWNCIRSVVRCAQHDQPGGRL